MTPTKRLFSDEHTSALRARLPVFVVVTVLLAARPCAAQSAESPPPHTGVADSSDAAPAMPLALQDLSTNTLRVWLAGSFATGHLIGNVQRAQVRMLGLRYERLLVPPAPHRSLDGATLTYTADVIPILDLSIPPNTLVLPPLDRKSDVREQGIDTYGVGISPAGLRLTYRVASRVQPYLAGSTGLAYLFSPVPGERGRQLNFLFDVGAGLRLVLTSDLVLTAGYRYHHLSNGFRGQLNPGVDANLFHVGVTIPH